VLDYWLNIMGSEWIIIIFVALIVLLGTNKFPEVAGKVVGEYKKAKNDIENQFKDFSNANLDVAGPVQNERQKLDMIAKSLGINSSNKTEEELRKLISTKIGKQDQEKSTENNSKSLS